MKKEDVSKIKLGSPAFTKKWWQDRRPLRLNGCGVGKALDKWQKHCPKNPETILDGGKQTLARNAAWELMQAMTSVKGKCSSAEKHTKAATEAYIAVAEAYRNDIGKKSIKDSQDEAEMKKLFSAMDTVRAKAKKVEQAGEDAVKSLKQYAATASGIQGHAEATLNGTGKYPLKKLGELLEGTKKSQSSKEKSVNKALDALLGEIDTIEKSAKKLISTKNEKVISDFSKEMAFLLKLKQSILDVNSDCTEAIRATERTISQTKTSEAEIKQMLARASVILYENPGNSLKDFGDLCIEAEKNFINPIMAFDADTLTEKKQKDVRDQLHHLRAEMDGMKNLLKTFIKTDKLYRGRLKKHMDMPMVKDFFEPIPTGLKAAASALKDVSAAADKAEAYALKLLALEPVD